MKYMSLFSDKSVKMGSDTVSFAKDDLTSSSEDEDDTVRCLLCGGWYPPNDRTLRRHLIQHHQVTTSLKFINELSTSCISGVQKDWIMQGVKQHGQADSTPLHISQVQFYTFLFKNVIKLLPDSISPLRIKIL